MDRPPCFPGLAGLADSERESKLDAERVTLEFESKSARPLDAGRLPMANAPLFGGDPREELFP